MSSSLAPAAFSFASGMARAVARANVHAGVNNRIAPRLIDSLSKDVVDDIFVHALKKQTGVSLNFFHKELPVRLAHRVAELENLPYGLSAKGNILKVRDWYVESFKELRSYPLIRTTQDEHNFTNLLRSIYRRHANVVPVMAKGVAELRRELVAAQRLSELPEIHQFLDGFYLSRIGIRILIGQHIALHEPNKSAHIGLVCTSCSPIKVARDAIADARSICQREYGSSPEVQVYGDSEMTFPYVPSHLHHMLFELVKNSLRAVQDRFEDSDREPPPIRCRLSCHRTDAYLHLNRLGNSQEPLP
ncbi:MAG: hypothetical protein WDW38_008775 [Sanguina aurantia]